MNDPHWLVTFRRWMPRGPSRSAYAALIPYAKPEHLTGPLTARRHVRLWAREWLAEHGGARSKNTSHGYGSRLRVLLTDFAEYFYEKGGK